MKIDREKLLEDLKNTPELLPDDHDGSYELIREVVKSYATLSDDSKVSYLDLDAIYLCAVGSWKINIEKKKEKINSGCLPDSEKIRLTNVLDGIWDNACKKKYSNQENSDKPSIGMFGTGFMSFKTKTNDKSARDFVSMLVDISTMDDDNTGDIFKRCETVLKYNFPGMGAASASVVLHCLKPYVFPILNANAGNGNIYIPLGINLDKPGNIETYIENCRRITEFRDKYLPFKNYRILDRKAWELENYEIEDYIPSLSEYDPGITAEKWKELIKDKKIFSDSVLHMMKCMLDCGGEASCIQLEKRYGGNSDQYRNTAVRMAIHVHEATNCPMSKRDAGNGDRYWAIPFVGRYTTKGEDGGFIWKLRIELRQALTETDLSNIPLYLAREEKHMGTDIGRNTILYGPPGTGKTYETARYAVSIIDDVPIDKLRDVSYDEILEKYKEYKEQGLIEFTTFHQSYGYEEFIEGIRPIMDATEDTKLRYKICSGVFKRFCEKAGTPAFTENELELNSSPIVWKVSLEGTGDNLTRSECMLNEHIRIGWDEYGQSITDETEYNNGGKRVLDAFVNKMRIGDIVLSCYSASTIDAIGVVTGEYEWHDEYDKFKRLRNVKWFAKEINENILELNNGKAMTLATVYAMDISVVEVLNMLKKVAPALVSSEEKKKNYVFIIDEINRGNISKIFGELITLIEDSKRLGMPEGMKAKLPYSMKSFGVPNNVYLLGTMNTADRSITTLDTALRRRFDFIEMMPKLELLDSLYVENISILKMLYTMNKRIELLYDREHTIGHAYFMPLEKEPTIANLHRIFKNKIIPLLQEYFFDDYEKISLVLNDNNKVEENRFIRKIDDYQKLFSNSEVDFGDSVRYEINEEAFSKEDSYISIY